MRGLHAVLQLEDSELEELSNEEKTFVVNMAESVHAKYFKKLTDDRVDFETVRKVIEPDMYRLGNILNTLQPGRVLAGI